MSHASSSLNATVTGLCLALAGLAEAGEVRVTAPGEFRELRDSVEVHVSAENVWTNSVTLEVRLGEVDVTSLVQVQQTSLDVDDPNEDGLAENLLAEYLVTFTSVDPVAGDDLVIVGSGNSLEGPFTSRGVTHVISHVALNVTDVFLLDQIEPQHVFAEIRDATVSSQELSVWFQGADVTAAVGVVGPTALDQIPSETTGYVRYRSQAWTFDPTLLGAADGQVVEVRLAVQTPLGVSIGSASTAALAAAPPTPVVKDAFATFIKKLKLEGYPGGKVNVKATSAEIQAAADEFQEAVEDEPNPGPIHEPNGEGKDPAGNPATFKVVGKYSKNASSKASASGDADAVVAIGADAADGGTSNGGGSSASNQQSGGAGVSVAGDGADGGSSGGDGADASATASGGSTGTAVSLGGTGGDPSPDHKEGGDGGGAEAGVGGSGSKDEGGYPGSEGEEGPPEEAGTHGLGSWARRDRGVNGSGPGPNDPKSATNTGD